MKKDIKKIKIFTKDDFEYAEEDREPTNKQNHVGVEIECFGPVERKEMVQYLHHMDLLDYVAVKDDGSIYPKGDTESYELAVCAEEKHIHRIISRLCWLLNELKFKVNSSCGLHIHIDMRNRDLSTVFQNLTRSQPLLYAMNPLSRTTGQYSQQTKSDTFEEYKRTEPHYRGGINGSAYSKYQTIEVRIHAGTVNADKINNWIKLLIQIANLKKPIIKEYNFKAYKKMLNLNKKLNRYIRERLKKFNKKFLTGEISPPPC